MLIISISPPTFFLTVAWPVQGKGLYFEEYESSLCPNDTSRITSELKRSSAPILQMGKVKGCGALGLPVAVAELGR